VHEVVLMGVGERFGDVAPEHPCLLERERSVLQAFLECGALDQLDDQIRALVLDAGVVQADDARVIKA
jgi:hypothetical protein